MDTPTLDSPTLELRILSGPQAGAALPLADRNMVIGSGHGCDVILQSPCIAPRHACVSVDGNGFSVDALDGGIAAAEDAPGTAPWPFGTTIYLGEIGITIEDGGQAWKLPSRSAEVRKQAPANNISALLARPAQHWKRFALVLAFLIIAAAGSQIVLGKQGAARTQGKLSASDVDAIERIVARYRGAAPPDTSLKLERAPKGLMLHGYLPGAGQLNALRRDLSRWRPALAFDVHADDALLAASRRFLQRQQSALKASIASGRVVLSGFEERREDVMRLAEDLKNNVPGLAGVEATFVEQPRLEAWLRTWRKNTASSSHADDAMHIEATPDGVLTLQGTLSQSRIAQLKQALTQHSLRQNMLLAMRVGLEMRPGSGDLPPTVRAFSLGPVPYVFLDNGRRLMIGGDFNGFELVAIKGQGPVFEKKGG